MTTEPSLECSREEETTQMEHTSLKTVKTYTVEEALKLLGGFSFFQWILIFILSLNEFPQDSAIYIMVFHSYKPEWRCLANSTICTENRTFPAKSEVRCKLPRTEWEYTTPKELSISTDFDLICDREWMQSLLSSVVFIGWAIGALILGYAGDNYGRKRVNYPSMFLIIVFGTVLSFLDSPGLIIACRLIIGFFVPGMVVQTFVLISEYVDTEHRPYVTFFYFTLAIPIKFLLLLKAYYIKQWRILQLVCNAPYFVLLLTYFFVPKSIRWMRIKGLKDEMHKTLKRVAYWNRREYPADMNIEPVSEKVSLERYTIVDVFRTRKLALTSCILGYTWLVNGMVYYAFYLGSGSLGGSLYTNFALMSVMGFPSEIINAYSSRKIGRKKTTLIGMFVASVLCLSISFMTGDDEYVIRVVFACLGNLFIGISFSAIYTWSVELYATTIRANAMGFLQVMARIGAASASWVAIGLSSVHEVAPYVVMGGVTFIGSFGLLWLPETAERPLFEVEEDGGRKKEKKEEEDEMVERV